MIVSLIGTTELLLPERVMDTKFDRRMQENWFDGKPDANADLLAEVAGRLCYDSYNLPSENTRDSKGYLANIIRQQHFSVMEHASAAFLVEGVSRSLLMEFRTHRHLSFSARSTRYVNESDSGYVTPPALRKHLNEMASPVCDEDFTVQHELDNLWDHAQAVYQNVYDLLIRNGATRKEAREAAREFLPGATETEFVVSGNHAAWRLVLQKRLAPGAAAEIRELAQEILRQLRKIAPNTYQDFEDEK